MATTPAGVWFIGAALTQPIFTAGRTRSHVALSTAQQQEAVLTYQQTIKLSFSEVADALVGYRKGQEFLEHQQALNRAAADAPRLADIRCRGGGGNQLSGSAGQRHTRMFPAELGVTEAKLGELLAFVQIYRALGGRWQS